MPKNSKDGVYWPTSRKPWRRVSAKRLALRSQPRCGDYVLYYLIYRTEIGSFGDE